MCCIWSISNVKKMKLTQTIAPKKYELCTSNFSWFFGPHSLHRTLVFRQITCYKKPIIKVFFWKTWAFSFPTLSQLTIMVSKRISKQIAMPHELGNEQCHIFQLSREGTNIGEIEPNQHGDITCPCGKPTLEQNWKWFLWPSLQEKLFYTKILCFTDTLTLKNSFLDNLRHRRKWNYIVEHFLP